MQENLGNLKKLGVSIAKNVSQMGFRKNGNAMTFRQGLDVVAKLGGMKAWQAVAAMKPAKGALKPDGNAEYHHDYALEEGESVWITVKGHSIYINPTDEGVVVDVYAKGAENNGTIATTYAFDSEAEGSYCEDNQIDIDDVAEWVGLHYKVNFDAESAVKRMEWLHRYVEIHGIGKDDEVELDFMTKSLLDELPAAKQSDQWELQKDDDVEDLFKLTVTIDGIAYPTAIGFSSEAEYAVVEEGLKAYYHSHSPQTSFARDLLSLAGVEVTEDVDQPGMFLWRGACISWTSKREAGKAAVREVCGMVMGYFDMSSEVWDALSSDQKLNLARDWSENQ